MSNKLILKGNLLDHQVEYATNGSINFKIDLVNCRPVDIKCRLQLQDEEGIKWTTINIPLL